MQQAEPSNIGLDYGWQPHRVSLRRLVRPALLVLLTLSVPVVFWLTTTAYVAQRWRNLTPGMARAHVDRQLWAFTSHPNPTYQGLGPGQFVVRYELFRMGKATMIQVVFNADGTVSDAQPIYDI
jgi:hypothetical protein